MKKPFIITVDTEGDNQWTWKAGDSIKTENTSYLQRFQDLCNKYNYKPVWLTNQEMIEDPRYVKFICEVVNNNQGELGMHLHAWSTKPNYNLPIEEHGAPYLIEYPIDVVREKVSYLTKLIYFNTGIRPVTHRAGRWAMNQDYFDVLIENGYLVDCSVTPGIDWSNHSGQTSGSKGSDYSKAPVLPYIITNSSHNLSILEVPMSIRKRRGFVFPEVINLTEIGKSVYFSVKSRCVWLRPTGKNLPQMKALVDDLFESEASYIMFMIHSSELMPGGSPNFVTDSSIEKLYRDIECLFDYIQPRCEGMTLQEYYQVFKSK